MRKQDSGQATDSRNSELVRSSEGAYFSRLQDDTSNVKYKSHMAYLKAVQIALHDYEQIQQEMQHKTLKHGLKRQNKDKRTNKIATCIKFT